MVRWAPDAFGRLERAAMELYVERGFDTTTVAEIAERAGLTERTFFRHFADKREVLFYGAAHLQAFLVAEVDAAPPSVAALDVIIDALVASAAIFESGRDHARRRQSLIAGNAELRERELIKLASLADTLADALRRRGVRDPAAALAAEAGITVFKVAFDTWATDPGGRSLAELIRESVDELSVVTGGRATGPEGRPPDRG